MHCAKYRKGDVPVKVLSIPTTWEMSCHENPTRAWLFWKISHLGAPIVAAKTLIAEADLCFIACWTAHGHTETLESYQIREG